MAGGGVSIRSVVVVVPRGVAGIAIATVAIATILVITPPLGVVTPLPSVAMAPIVAGLLLIVVAMVTLALASVVVAHLLAEEKQT